MSLPSTHQRFLLAILGVLLLIVAATYAYRDTLGLDAPRTGEQVENLRAFAKLYGYVRFFHPSDAAADTDWERFAIYGARRVKNASSTADLRATLDSLFAPIAPTVQLYPTGGVPPKPPAVLEPTDTTGLHLMAWQHKGAGLEDIGRYPEGYESLYESRRLHRNFGKRPLYEAKPAPGEVVSKPLGRGLSARVPLALYGQPGQTLRPVGAPAPDSLRERMSGVLAGTRNEVEGLYPADVVIAWNVFQHFYPYFGVVDTDWDQVLTRSLHRSLADTSRVDFLGTLRQMVAALKDGHGRVHHADEERARLPLQFDWVEEKIVVADTASYADGAGCAKPGDIVVSIEGTPAKKALRRRKRFVSGAPQWKTVRALARLGWPAPSGSTLPLKLKRQGRTVHCELPRGDALRARRWNKTLQSEPRPGPVDTLSGGTRYVDLTRAETEVLQPRLDALAQAEAVIFDMRGYPASDLRGLLQHLSQDTLRSARWEVPKFIYPDQENQVGYTTARWTLPPKKPHFTGEITFLTGPGAISNAESIMGIVEHYQLGEIVGQATAGTNGNINPFELPGGYRVSWTGMRVRKHDGSQHHLVGIQPTVKARRTIEGVRAGEDEVLQEALEMTRRGSKGD